MARALEEEQESYKSRPHRFRGKHENGGRRAQSMEVDIDNNDRGSPLDERASSRSYGSTPFGSLDNQQLGTVFNPAEENGPKSRIGKEAGGSNKQPTDMDLLKERFAKLLLGEDMSGGGKGVSLALALSNAITNLAVSIFGEQGKLEPMSVERKARWRREIDWLLSVTDHIVEFVACQQKSKDGTNMEVIMFFLIQGEDCLDNFKGQNEFTYVSKDADGAEKAMNRRKDDKLLRKRR